jgi:hypothetical protein
MKPNELEDAVMWTNMDYFGILCKAILLNKVSIVDGRILVKALKEYE